MTRCCKGWAGTVQLRPFLAGQPGARDEAGDLRAARRSPPLGAGHRRLDCRGRAARQARRLRGGAEHVFAAAMIAAILVGAKAQHRWRTRSTCRRAGRPGRCRAIACPEAWRCRRHRLDRRLRSAPSHLLLPLPHGRPARRRSWAVGRWAAPENAAALSSLRAAVGGALSARKPRPHEPLPGRAGGSEGLVGAGPSRCSSTTSSCTSPSRRSCSSRRSATTASARGCSWPCGAGARCSWRASAPRTCCAGRRSSGRSPSWSPSR